MIKNKCCLDGLKDMASQSIDLILTSPPYNMNLRIRNGKYCSRQITKELTTKYTNFSDNLNMDDYFDFNDKVIAECLRVSSLVFYNVQFLTGNKPALFKLIGKYGDKIKEVIVWDKINAQPAIGELVLNSQFEVILIFENDCPESRKFNNAQFKRGKLSNVWAIKRGKKYVKGHGAVFPIDLAYKVIENFTKKGHKVCDPFAGSGTTGVACKYLQRDFIGFEIDKNYALEANQRIKNAQSGWNDE